MLDVAAVRCAFSEPATTAFVGLVGLVGVLALTSCGGKIAPERTTSGGSSAGAAGASGAPEAGSSGGGAIASTDAGSGALDSAGGPQSTVVASFGSGPLTSLWGSSSQDIWLVGGTVENMAGGRPPASERIVHFDGNGWNDVQTPSSFALSKVWGASANDVWAGGGDGIVSGQGVMVHYDGMAWSQVAQVSDSVAAIWGSSTSDVWFAGGVSIWHWNGSAISLVSAPNPPDAFLTLWGFSASDVWVGGASGTLMHWDGSAWNLMATNGLYIFGLWGASSDDLWGVGNGGYQLHWNGTAVENTNIQGYSGFDAIYGLSASDIWALGTCCWEQGVTQPWGAHYDGVRWTYQELPGIGFASALWATPPGTYFALVDNTLVRWP